MSTVDLLRAHAPSAPEHLHHRVLELRPVESQHRRVRPVLVLAAAAAIAIVAAVLDPGPDEHARAAVRTDRTAAPPHRRAPGGAAQPGAARGAACAPPDP